MKELQVSHIIRMNESLESGPFSGAENHLLFLLPELVKLGVDVELIVVFRSWGPLMEDTFQQLAREGVKITPLPLAGKADWRVFGIIALQRMSDLMRLLRVRRNRIIHLHLDYFGTPVTAWLSGCSKIVMSIHNDEEWLGSCSMRVWLRILNLAIKHYIAISDRVKEYFIGASRIRPFKITRIYYGVKYENRNRPTEIRKKYNIPGDRFVVGFIGRLVYQKNVELLVEAAQMLPEAHFVLVGDGDMRRVLQEQAQGIENIQFLGYQPNGYKLMSGFDVFCLPSRFEGLGLVLVEAMLQSVPIVASRAGAIPEILGDGRFGLLFEPGNATGLSSAIKLVMNKSDDIRTMTNRARDYANEVFDIRKMALETRDVYLDV